MSLPGIPIFPCQPARLSHPRAGLARTSPDIVVRECVLGIYVIYTEQHRLKKCIHWHVRQYTEFVVAVQPMALFPLLTTLTRAVCGIEIVILRAFLNIQISQQHDAWISELLYDSSPHYRLLALSTTIDIRIMRTPGQYLYQYCRPIHSGNYEFGKSTINLTLRCAIRRIK